MLSRGEYDTTKTAPVVPVLVCLFELTSTFDDLIIPDYRPRTYSNGYGTVFHPPPPPSSSSSWLENTHYQNDNQTFTYSMPRLTLPPPPPPRQKKKKQKKKKEKRKTQTPPEIPDFHG